MEDKKVHFTNNSGDPTNYTMVPNMVIETCDAVTVSIYSFIKKHAGEKGICFVSDKNIMKDLKIGRVALKNSFTTLMQKRWVKYEGLINVDTTGGPQKVKSYSISNVWEENKMFYKNNKGGVYKTPLSGQRGRPNVAKGVLCEPTNKNPSNKMVFSKEKGTQPKELTPEERKDRIRQIRENVIEATKVTMRVT